MSLVAYDSSDEEKDEEIVTQPSQITDPKHTLLLPAKRQRECVKISIPSLKEFEKEDIPVAPKRQKSQSGSGLFSLLPPPKNASTVKKPTFVPYVLSSKKEASQSVSKKCMKPTEMDKPTEMGKSKALDEQNFDNETFFNEETSNKDENSADFFSLESLNSDTKLVEKSCFSSDYNIETHSSSVTLKTYDIKNEPFSVFSSHIHQVNDLGENLYMQPCHSQEDIVNSEQMTTGHSEQLDSSINHCTDYEIAVNNGESLLNDKEFLKLQGRRKEFEGVNIIDVNADDQLTDRKEWLMKSLTEESTHRPSRKKHHMPTQQQKRKHQISYLAFQAKEREMDLKNQWAMNSRTRRETQAKYGF